MHDAAIVQKRNARSHAAKPFQNLFHRHPFRIPSHNLVQTIAGHILHHNPVVAVFIRLHVEDGDEIRVLQIQALRHATQFDFQIVVQQLQGNFFARVAKRVVDLTEPTAVDGSLDGEPIKWRRFWCKGELHLLALLVVNNLYERFVYWIVKATRCGDEFRHP